MEQRAMQDEHDGCTIEPQEDAFFRLDTGWNFTEVNPECERLLHRGRNSLLGLNIWKEYPEAVGDTSFQAYHRAMAEQVEQCFEALCPSLNTRISVRACPSTNGLSVYFRMLAGGDEDTGHSPTLSFSQSVLDSLSSHIAVLDSQGVIIAVNESWRRFAAENGAPPFSAEVGTNYLEVCDQAGGSWSEEAPTVATAIRDILTGRRTGFEIEYPCHSESMQRWFRLRLTSFEDAGQRRAVVDHQNITEQKLLELERDRFFTLSLDLLCVVNEEGFCTRVNPAFERTLGYSEQEFLSRPLIDFVDAEDRETTRKAVQQLAHDQSLTNFINRVRCSDGSLRYIAWTSVRYDGNAYTVGRDITNSLEAYEEHKKLRHLLEDTHDFLGWIKTDGTVEYFNSAAQDLLGLPEDVAIEDRHIGEFLPEWAANVVENEGFCSAALNGTWSGELAILDSDHREIPVSMVITAYSDAHGRVLFFSLAARDISDPPAPDDERRAEFEEGIRRRTAELELTNRRLKGEAVERQMVMGQLREVVSQLEGARNEALRAQRNAEQARQEAERAREEAENANHSKSEFLSRMSHELRTPLNAILGFGQLLQMDSTMPPKRRASVDHILTAGEHLLNLINEVLDISRIDVGNLSLSLEPIAAQSAVEEALGLMRPLAEPHHIALHNEISESLNRYVLADRQRLKQVLLNLISNAIKYNRPRGSVTLRAEDHPEDRLRISVIDTGNGLSPADLAKLFTPFERLGATMTRIEGTGIGLVLSRRLAEAMGGQIGVHSELGVGSTFWVELPLTADPKLEVQAQLQQTEHFEPAVPSSVAEHTILYIEDNLPNLELVEMMLQDRSDVRLLSASLGVAGLKLAIEHHPALILLDFHLPDMNGDEILGRLRGRPETRDIPVVIISADATPGQIQRGLAAGASEYLTKPINVRQFLKIVETCLDGTPETGTDSPA